MLKKIALLIFLIVIGLTRTEVIMPNIPKIKIGNTEYDVSDALVRTAIMNTKNLFDINDPDNVWGGYYIGQATFTVNAAFGQTGFIPVTAGKSYASQCPATRILWFDSGKTFIGETASTNWKTTARAITGAAYGRFLFKVDEVEQFYVVEVENASIQSFGSNRVQNENRITDLEKKANHYIEIGPIGLVPGNNMDGVINTQYTNIVNSGTMFCKRGMLIHITRDPSSTIAGHHIKVWQGDTPSDKNRVRHDSYPIVEEEIYEVPVDGKMCVLFSSENNVAIQPSDITAKITLLVPYDNQAYSGIRAKNLVTPFGEHLFNQYYNTSGELASVADVCQSELIPVNPNHLYIQTGSIGLSVLYYNANKELIGYILSTLRQTNGGNMIKFPSTAVYARFTFLISEIHYAGVYDLTDLSFDVYEKGAIRKKYGDDVKGVAFGTSLTARANIAANQGYLDYLRLSTGISFDNQGIGSATILEYQDSQLTLLNILQVIKSYENYSDKEICILEGFVNDWVYNASKLGTYTDTEETTVCGCVRAAIDYIKSQNPEIHIFAILDHYGKLTNSIESVNSNGDTQYEFYEELAKLYEFLGIRVIKGYAISGFSEKTPDWILDNIHPTPEGCRQFAMTVYGQIKNDW